MGRGNTVPGVPWVNFELPEDLHRRARSRAALRGKKFYTYLVQLIREGVERDEAEEDQQPPSR
jgi:hypothetical protein